MNLCFTAYWPSQEFSYTVLSYNKLRAKQIVSKKFNGGIIFILPLSGYISAANCCLFAAFIMSVHEYTWSGLGKVVLTTTERLILQLYAIILTLTLSVHFKFQFNIMMTHKLLFASHNLAISFRSFFSNF